MGKYHRNLREKTLLIQKKCNIVISIHLTPLTKTFKVRNSRSIDKNTHDTYILCYRKSIVRCNETFLRDFLQPSSINLQCVPHVGFNVHFLRRNVCHSRLIEGSSHAKATYHISKFTTR